MRKSTTLSKRCTPPGGITSGPDSTGLCNERLARPRPLPGSSGLRVALVSKLLNNLSRFSVCRHRTDALTSPVVGSGFLKEEKHLPSYCLSPEGPGPEALMVSSSRVALPEGCTFSQASLSSFYWAVQLALGADGSRDGLDNRVCLPLRAFNAECLVASDGASVVGRLLEHCDYLIVEDADLRPEELVEHLRTFSLQELTACDMTKALGLMGNHAYVLWGKNGKKP